MATFDDPDDDLFDSPAPRKPKPSNKIVFQPAGVRWSLDRLPEVDTLYQTSFKKKLPLVNKGQGSIHNRWGYDHRNSADVSVNPSSPEGQQFMESLKKANVPFLAFTGAIPNVATGPHIHIGFPSSRTAQRFNVGAQKKGQRIASDDLFDAPQKQTDDDLFDSEQTPPPKVKPRATPQRATSAPTNAVEALQQLMESTNRATQNLERQAGRQPTPRVRPQIIDKSVPSMMDIARRAIDSPEGRLKDQIREQVRRETPAPLRTPWNEGAQPDFTAQNEEVERRFQAAQRANTPEMIAARKEYGREGAPVRAVTQPIGRFAAGALKTVGGITSAFGIAPNKVSDWANERGQFVEESTTNAPLTEAGEEIQRGIPEKVAQGLADMGITIGQLMVLKRATRLPMNQLMVLESAAKTSDRPASERIAAATEAYALGTVLEQHLGRAASAAVFGTPTALRSGAEFAAGRMSPEDFLIQTGIDVGVGGLLGPKKPSAFKRAFERLPPREPVAPDAEIAATLRGQRTVPERSETIDAQIKAVREGTRDAVLIPPNTPRPRNAQGLRSQQTPEGIFYFDPNRISRETIQQKVTDGTYGELLGHVAKKPELGEPTAVVTARSPEGTEVQSSAVAPEKVAEQARATEAQNPRAEVEVGGPELAERVIAEREAELPEAVRQAQARLAKTTEPATETTASVPFMITRQMTADLKARGMSQAEINKLTPQQANDILAKPAPPEPAQAWQVERPKVELTAKEREVYDWAEDGAKDVLTDEGWLRDNPDALTRAGQVEDIRQRLEDQAPDVFEGTGSKRIIQSLVRKLEASGYFTEPAQAPLTQKGRPASQEEKARAILDDLLRSEQREVRDPFTGMTESERKIQDLENAGWTDRKITNEFYHKFYKRLSPEEQRRFDRFHDKLGGTLTPLTDSTILTNWPVLIRMKDALDRLAAPTPEAKQILARQPKSIAPTAPISKAPKPEKAATPELQHFADEAASVRAKSTPELTKVERDALERKAKRLDAKARGEELRRSGADPYELIDDLIIRGGELIRQGKAKFDEWSKKLREEYGADAEKHFKDVYAQLTKEATSIKNEATAELRRELDLSEIERPEQKSWQTSIDNAEQKGLTEKTVQIADKVIAGNREVALDLDESAALLIKTRELENRWEEVYAKNPNDPELADIKAQLDKYSTAVDMGGTETARTLNFRRAMMDKSFRLISLIRQAEKAKGRKVTPEETQRYADLVKERDSALAERDAALAKLAKSNPKAATDHFVQEQKVQIRKRGVRRTREQLVSERTELKNQFAELIKAPSLAEFIKSEKGEFDPAKAGEAAKILRDLARNYIEEGVVKADDLVTKVHDYVKDVSKVTKREVSDLISGYGRIQQPTRDPIEQKLNEIKSILAATSGRADVLEKAIRPLRRGQQREKPTEDQRRALRELNEAMRERGPELGRQPFDVKTEQATPLDKAKTTTRNRIEQLKTWISEGKKEVQGGKQVIPDAELTQLKAERSVLEKVASLIEDPLADQKAIERRLTELNKSIAELQKGDTGTKVREGAKQRWSPEIGALEKERAALRRVISDMRTDAAKKAREAEAAKPAGFYGAEQTWAEFEAEAKRSLTRVKQLEAREKEYERRVRERDFEPKQKTPVSYNKTVKEAEARVEIAENKFFKEMKRAEGGHQLRNISGLMKAWWLSGPLTHVKNIAGTGAYQVFDEGARVPGVIMDAMMIPAVRRGYHAVTGRGGERLSQRGLQGPSPVAMLASVHEAGTTGLSEASHIMLRGATKQQMERHQYQEVDFGVNTKSPVVNKAIESIELAHNAVFRFMSASDRVFYNYALKRNLIDRSTMRAHNEGLRGEAMRRRAKELESDPEIEASAKHDALVSTFNNNNALSTKIKAARAIEPESFLGVKMKSKKARQRFNAAENLALDMILPFDRTPTNVVMRIVEASPLGYMKNAAQLVKAAVEKGMTVEDQRQFSQTFGRATAGTALIAFGWKMADTLFDVDEKGNVYLKLGGRRARLDYVSPLGNLIATGVRLRKNHNAEKGVAADIKSVGREVLNIPALRATSGIMDIMQDPERTGTKAAARFVPIPFSGMSRTIAEATDKEADRKPSSFSDYLKMNIPVLRQQVPVDAEGRKRKEIATLTEQRRNRRVSSSLLKREVRRGRLTVADKKAIEEYGAMSPRQEEFTKRVPSVALERYERMDVTRRLEVKEIMEKKAWSLINSDSLTDAQKKDFDRRIKALGLRPKDPKKARV